MSHIMTYRTRACGGVIMRKEWKRSPIAVELINLENQHDLLSASENLSFVAVVDKPEGSTSCFARALWSTKMSYRQNKSRGNQPQKSARACQNYLLYLRSSTLGYLMVHSRPTSSRLGLQHQFLKVQDGGGGRSSLGMAWEMHLNQKFLCYKDSLSVRKLWRSITNLPKIRLD